MCRSLAEGGARCASHTRPAYQTAPFGTPEWDDAAAAYASTPTGRMELLASKAAAEEARDVNSIVAFEHALAQGERMREKAEAFREEYAAYTAPAPVIEEVEPEPVEFYRHEDNLLPENYYDSDDAYGDYDDEDHGDLADAYDFQPWSPTMVGQRWNNSDPTFAGCTPSMTSDQFIDRVCHNLDVSRADFEAAAARYLADNAVSVVSLVGDETRQFGFTGRGGTGFPLNSDQLRALLTSSGAAPRFTPEQIKSIALSARTQREQVRAQEEAAAAPASPAATPTAAPTAAPNTTDTPRATTNARRARSWELPEVPDDPAELTRLAASDDNKVREAVAKHENTPAATLVTLSKRPNHHAVRAQAARNPNLPAATLIECATDDLLTVRAGAARNPNLPSEYLIRMSEDASTKVVGAVARNPSTHEALYAALVRHELADVRKHAAMRKDVPDFAQRELTTDTDNAVRTALARNRTTSITTLRALSRDGEQSVRAAAVKNPDFPTSMLKGRVARDPAPGVRAAVAGNRSTPLGTLTRLATDPDPWVRTNVAWNDRTPAILLLSLRDDPDERVRETALRRITAERD